MLNLPRRFRFIIHKQKRRNQSDGRQLRSGWRRAFRRWRVVYVDVKSHANRGRKEQLSLKREKWAESHSGVAATLFKGPLIKWQSLYCLHMEDPIQHPATFCSPTHTAKIRARERERNSGNLQKIWDRVKCEWFWTWVEESLLFFIFSFLGSIFRTNKIHF